MKKKENVLDKTYKVCLTSVHTRVGCTYRVTIGETTADCDDGLLLLLLLFHRLDRCGYGVISLHLKRDAQFRIAATLCFFSAAPIAAIVVDIVVVRCRGQSNGRRHY